MQNQPDSSHSSSPTAESFVKASLFYQDGAYEQCLDCVNMITEADPDYESAFMMAVHACNAIVRQGKAGRGAERLLPLMQYCARNPSDTYKRSVIENLFRNEIIEPDAKVMLAAQAAFTVSPLISGMLSQLMSGGPIRMCHEAEGSNDKSLFLAFMDSAGEEILSGKQSVLGLNTLSPLLLSRARPQYIHDCLKELMEGEQAQANNRPETLLAHDIILHTLVSICEKFSDASSDYLALHFEIQYSASVGEHQRAKDLAEAGLLALTKRQRVHSAHRTALAWLCWSEAWLRTNQPMQAAQSLVYAASVKDAHPFSKEWAIRIPFIASRIFREIGIVPVARGFLLKRQEIISKAMPQIAAQQRLTVENEVAMLQLNLVESGSDHEMLAATLAQALALLKTAPLKEKASIASAAIQAARRLIDGGHTIEGDILREIEAAGMHLPTMLREPLTALITSTADAKALRRLIAQVPDARYKHDVAAAIRHLIPLAYKSVEISVSSGDSELYTIACSILSQPSLTAIQDGKAYIVNNQPTWLQMRTSTTASPEQVAQAYISGAATEKSYSFRSLAEINVNDFGGNSNSGEQLYLITLDEKRNLSHLQLSSHDSSKPKAVASNVWSAEKYRDWKKNYPFKYGTWTPSNDPFQPEEISADEVDESLRGIGTGISSDHRPITVMPSARLFGMPFNLLHDQEARHLGLVQPLAIAPSLPWLLQTRKTNCAIRRSWCAWMGGPNGTDLTLEFLRQKLAPTLNEFGFKIEVGSLPSGARGAGISVITLHGRLGTDGFFMNVSDGDLDLSPQVISENLENCQCVVLFVCSAGSSKPKADETEAHSMVTSLLENGVKAVIASPWPLAIDVAEKWLAPFMNCVNSGNTLFNAVWSANRAVKAVFDHPSAWAAMHLYGDGSLCSGIESKVHTGKA